MLMNFVYLIQTSSYLPLNYYFLKKNKKFILLSFKKKTEDTDIFYPNSTWTSGRNKLIEYVKENNIKAKYYIFLDDDIQFKELSNKQGFNLFEKRIEEYKPKIATTYLVGYQRGKHQARLKYQNKVFFHQCHYQGEKELIEDAKVQTVFYFDQACIAVHHSVLLDKRIFPYLELFDKISWLCSYVATLFRCAHYYPDSVYLFNELKVLNLKHHSNYGSYNNIVRGYQKTYKYILDSLNIKDFKQKKSIKIA